MTSALKEWNNNPVCVLTCDGRLIQGKLIGYDQLQNVILQEAQERVYQLPPQPSTEEEILEIVPLGLYIIRGDNVALISDVKEDIWENQRKNGYCDFTKDSEDIKPVVQFIN